MAVDPVSSQDPMVLAEVYQQRNIEQKVAGAEARLAKNQQEKQGEIATGLIESATRADDGRRTLGVA